MAAAEVRRDPALGRPIDEPEAQHERLVDVLDRVDFLGQHGGQGRDADRSRGELLDDRREQLAVRRVETLVIDLHAPHGVARRAFVDAAVAVDLGMVADALEQSIHDARRPPPAAGDGPSGGRIDRDVEDLGRTLDDLRQLVLRVEVEPEGRPEPVAQRRADPAGPSRRADHGERLEAEAQGPRARPLADHHVERVVLHRRVEDLLDRPIEPMDLVDEQHVALVERGEDRGQVAGPLDGGTRRVADVHAELARHDRREGRLAEAGRAVEEDVVGGLSPALRRLEEDRQVGLDLVLADVFGKGSRPQRAFDDEVRLVLEIAGQDVRHVVDHQAGC